MIFHDDRLYGNGAEPIALKDTGVCAACREYRSIWRITDSGWEYAGTGLCAFCLMALADEIGGSRDGRNVRCSRE